jgi:hypothetical protein
MNMSIYICINIHIYNIHSYMHAYIYTYTHRCWGGGEDWGTRGGSRMREGRGWGGHVLEGGGGVEGRF